MYDPCHKDAVLREEGSIRVERGVCYREAHIVAFGDGTDSVAEKSMSAFHSEMPTPSTRTSSPGSPASASLGLRPKGEERRLRIVESHDSRCVVWRMAPRQGRHLACRDAAWLLGSMPLVEPRAR